MFPAVDVERVGPEVLNVMLDSTHSSEDTSLQVRGDIGAISYTVAWTHLKQDGTSTSITQQDADPEKYTLHANDSEVLGNYSSEFSASLTIHNTELADSGVYTCTVFTIHHTSQAIFEVHVYGKCLWIHICTSLVYVCVLCTTARPSKPTLTKVTELKQIELICKSEGFPPPTLTWTRYSTTGSTELLQDDGNRLSITYAIEDGTAVTSRLVLTSLTLGDNGVYTCSVSADILGKISNVSESVSVTAGVCRSKL